MQNERLHKQQPERDSKHRPHGQTEKLTGTRVAKSGEGRKTERAEISQNPKSRYRNARDSGIPTPQHLEATSGSAANRRLTTQGQHSQVSCLRESGE